MRKVNRYEMDATMEPSEVGGWVGASDFETLLEDAKRMYTACLMGSELAHAMLAPDTLTRTRIDDALASFRDRWLQEEK